MSDSDVSHVKPGKNLKAFFKFSRSFWSGLRHDWLIYGLFVSLVVAIAAVVVGITNFADINNQNAQLRQLVECQNAYNEINNERTRLLAVAAERERQTEYDADAAWLVHIDSLSANNPDQAKIDRGLAILKRRLDEQSQARVALGVERREHPVPPPPRALCGDLPKK